MFRNMSRLRSLDSSDAANNNDMVSPDSDGNDMRPLTAAYTAQMLQVGSHI